MKYPLISLKIFNKKGEEVYTTYSHYKRRTLGRFNRYFQRGFKCFLRVVYAKGYWNEGEYNTKKDFMLAYKAFTEQSLIDEFKKVTK